MNFDRQNIIEQAQRAVSKKNAQAFADDLTRAAQDAVARRKAGYVDESRTVVKPTLAPATPVLDASLPKKEGNVDKLSALYNQTLGGFGFVGAMNTPSMGQTMAKAAYNNHVQFYSSASPEDAGRRQAWLADAESRVKTMPEGKERNELEEQINRYKRGEGEWASYSQDGSHQTGFVNATVDSYMNLLNDKEFMDKAERSVGLTHIPDAEEAERHKAMRTSGYTVVTPKYGEPYYVSNYDGAVMVKDGDELVHPELKTGKYDYNDPLGIYLSLTPEDKSTLSTAGNDVRSYAFNRGQHDHWDMLTPEEVLIYYGLLNDSLTGGDSSRAEQFLSDMKETLHHRFQNGLTANTIRKYWEANDAGRSNMGLETVLRSAESGAAGFIQLAIGLLTGNEPNYYSPAFEGMHFTNAVRGERAKDFDQKAPNLDILGYSAGDLYQLGMSAIDSTAASFIPGGQVLLGARAAANKGYELHTEGVNTEAAIPAAIASGAVEMAMEKVGIDRLKLLRTRDVSSWVDFGLNVLKQAGAEYGEEAATELADGFIDYFARTTESDWAKLLEKHNGDWGKFAADVLSQVNKAGIGGALSGFGSSVTALPNAAATITQNRDAVTQVNPEIATPQPEITPAEKGALEMAKLFGVKDYPGVETEAANEPESTKQNQTENDNAHIKDQLRNNQSTLNALDPVAEVQVPTGYSQMDRASKLKWIENKLRSTGFSVDRKGFGVIDFAMKRIKKAIRYFNQGSVEDAAFEAIPYVLEKGVEITTRDNHKNRDYGTTTFAAPVIINGKRGNMGVVVKQTDGNHYKVHRILTPDGSVFELSEENNKAEPTTAGESPETGSLATPKGSASDPIISDSARKVNPEDSVGAAPHGFDQYSTLQYEHGNIPGGENPVRPDDAPISTDGVDRVSRTARTAIGAAVTPDEFVPLIENETVRGGFSFIPITNNETVQRAMAEIQADGWERSRGNWEAQVRNGQVSADIIAMGGLLYNNAVNNGDFNAAMDILLDYSRAARNAAQGLQATRILKRLTPENRLYMIRRSVQRMVEDMQLGTPVTINEDLARQYQESQNNEEADRILDEIARDVARQIPPTWRERITALRYLNMLGNFRTQARNLVGNLTNKGLYFAKDELAAALEALASWASGGRFQRTKSIVRDRATRRAAAADYDNVADWISGGGRTNDRGDASDDFAGMVEENRRIFRFAPIEAYRRATNWAMNNDIFGDAAFGRGAYARALAGYLNARGIRTDDLSTVDPQTLNAAREYAVRQAQEATFRDNNRVSTFFSQALRGENTPTWARVIGEAVMPFRKTPANVLVRSEEFSPLGLINSAVNTVRAANGDISGAELVDSWAKSLTGTVLFALGYALANMGLLRGGPDEDEDKAEFDKLNGYQDYSIQLPGGLNFTIDAFSPTALPLLLGAQMDKVLDGTDITFADLEGMISTLADPMIEMSMLSGLNDTIDAIKYADNSLGQFLVNAAFNYLTQAVGNTLLGQIERSTEESRMTTYVDKNSQIPAWLQRNLGNLSQKIPGWDYNQTKYIDAWGREQDNPKGLANWIYNLFSPSYIDRAEVDNVAQELYRLNDAQTGVKVFPKSPENTITRNYIDETGEEKSEKINLTAQQHETYQKTEGQAAYKMAELIINSDAYKELPDAYKATALELAYKHADELGKAAAVDNYTYDIPAYLNGSTETTQAEADAILEKVYQDWSGLSPAGYAKAAKYGIDEAAASKMAADVARKRNLSGDTSTYGTYRAVLDSLDGADKKERDKWLDIYGMSETARQQLTQAESLGITPSNFVGLMEYASAEKNEKRSFSIPRHLELVGSGLNDSTAKSVQRATSGLSPEGEYKTVRDIQKLEAITDLSSLSNKQKEAAILAYTDDGLDAKYHDLTRQIKNATPDDFVEYYRACVDGKNKSEDIAALRALGLSPDVAEQIYKIYNQSKKK